MKFAQSNSNMIAVGVFKSGNCNRINVWWQGRFYSSAISFILRGIPDRNSVRATPDCHRGTLVNRRRRLQTPWADEASATCWLRTRQGLPGLHERASRQIDDA